jgi:hemerythrin-like domain-containing protein
MKATDFLIQEHKAILRALDVLDAVCASVEETAAVDDTDVQQILEFLRWFADGHHQAKEETILFPALKRAAASQGRPVEHLIFEHGQERSLVEEMEKDVRLANVEKFVACANRLSSTLRNHIYKEDRILFDSADALLGPEQDDALFDALSQFDTTRDKQVMKERLAELHSLEWKYLRR